MRAVPVLLLYWLVCLVLVLGLYAGRKWAYVLALLGVLLDLSRLRAVGDQRPGWALWIGLISLSCGLSLLASTGYFWRANDDPESKPCGQCGQNLAGVADSCCPVCGWRIERTR